MALDEEATNRPQKEAKTVAAKRVVKRPRKPRSSKKSAQADDYLSGDTDRWTFPKNTLENSIEVLKAIEEKYAGNPSSAEDVARAVGYNKPSDWRFRDLLKSANLYGIVTGSGQSATVAITATGQDIIAPSTPNDRVKALWDSFRKVEDFRKVEEFYKGKRIPDDEFFTNTLVRQFNIPRNRVETFSEIFKSNINYLRAFAPSETTDSTMFSTEVASTSTPSDKIPGPSVGRETRPRQFLDTCFVMMPFGSWFDRYYQEIYVPAIKEAGFEPVRADELFSTGSVMEQIWEQIEKAKVLLADLTGKNANVFYELGLSHAAGKPVVFTAALVDDVPFDLRHLRVIIYEVREPDWASRLRKSISDYLRNAAKEPTKSIPHPFRFIETRNVMGAEPQENRL